MKTRRAFIQNLALLTAFTGSSMDLVADSVVKKRNFKIGACDWSLGKNCDIGVFDVAKEIGLDGVMVSMGSLSDNLRLRDITVQQ